MTGGNEDIRSMLYREDISTWNGIAIGEHRTSNDIRFTWYLNSQFTGIASALELNLMYAYTRGNSVNMGIQQITPNSCYRCCAGIWIQFFRFTIPIAKSGYTFKEQSRGTAEVRQPGCRSYGARGRPAPAAVFSARR